MESNNHLLITRATIIETIRKYFWNEGFIETDTPAMVFSPGMEPHITPIEVHEQGVDLCSHRAFLHTSPEFAMKKILAKGFDKIFQICKCYRAEPKSTTHEPEFTMLEWYRANAQYESIMDDCEKLFQSISKALKQKVHTKWPRYSILECFQKFSDIDLTTLLPANSETTKKFFQICKKRNYTNDSHLIWDDYFFLIMMNEIEPKLAKESTPVIIHSYPESQAALSNLSTDSGGIKWAKRFEVYANGLELANAFDELTDSTEQRARFERDRLFRKKQTGHSSPIDEDFLNALTKMKPSAGIALGVDRLIMYFTNQTDIQNIIWQKSYWNSHDHNH